MIHYHGTPCSGRQEEAAIFLTGRHSLVPWSYQRDMAVAAEVCQSFCLDNGAFTAWKSGEPISDWSGYYAWVDKWRRHPGFDWAIIPDVIDGTENDNDDLIRAWPFKTDGVPVWHLHESLQRLRELCEYWPRVCLGSSGRWATVGSDSWWDRMGEAMGAACGGDGRPLAKLHGLRMLDPAIFHRLPLASADSTNAVRNASLLARFGMYPSPNDSTRMSIIAERVETHQSAAVWVPLPEQKVLVWHEAV